MTFKDTFNIDELFNPSMFYIGSIHLGDHDRNFDILLMNAKVKGKKNMYAEFLEKYYYQPMSVILKSKSLSYVIPPLLEISDREDGRRRTTFSLVAYAQAKAESTLTPEEDYDECLKVIQTGTQEDLIQFIKNILRKDRRRYEDVLNNGKKSQYYDIVFDIYQEYMRSSRTSFPFSEFLISMKSGFDKSIIGSRQFVSFFNQDIDIEKLVDCFDYDKFCLLAAQSILDRGEVNTDGKLLVNNAILYVYRYLEAVEEYRQANPNYQTSIVVNDYEKNKKKVITIDDVKRDFERLMSHHPEFKRFRISVNRVAELLRMFGYDENYIANFDVKSKDAEALVEIVSKIEANKALLASWDIIPKGKREASEILPVPHDSAMPLSEQEKIRRMVIGRDFLENSGYLFYLEGINEFEGYIGYLYPSGTVIFEKYYEDIASKRVASGNATYVMHLDNFVEVSKLTKSDIIAKINRGEITGVSRIFHREDMDKWKSQVSQAISGSDYSQDVIGYIDSLVNEAELKKKNSLS